MHQIWNMHDWLDHHSSCTSVYNIESTLLVLGTMIYIHHIHKLGFLFHNWLNYFQIVFIVKTLLHDYNLDLQLCLMSQFDTLHDHIKISPHYRRWKARLLRKSCPRRPITDNCDLTAQTMPRRGFELTRSC